MPVATLLTEVYNSALIGAIQSLTAGQGANVHFLDTFSLINAAVADPGAFGLSNATDRCYIGPLTGGGTVCAAPDSYLFWDGQHPTAAADALVAAAAAAALPEPPAAPTLLLGACAAVVFRGRARLKRA